MENEIKVDGEIKMAAVNVDDAYAEDILSKVKAAESTINVPSWVLPQNRRIYMIAYMQVKEHPVYKQYNATKRKSIIKDLMNKHILKAVDILQNKLKTAEDVKKENALASRRF